jgi:Glycosyl transferase family 2
VVVDDASTDGTLNVVEQVAATDARVVLLRAPANGGASAARNLGLAAARGEWLTFLDSDDVILPGGLEALVAAVADGETRAVVGQRVWSDGRTRWITATYDQPDIRTPVRRTSIVERPGLLFYASATGKLFHRSLVDGLAFEGRVLGDQPWTIRALLRAGDRISVIGDVVYEWRRDLPAGTSSITAAKRDSARLAAEAARVAIRALAEVADEAAVQLGDRGARDRVVAAYFDRLVRSDFAGPVRRAVARGDAGTAELLAAIEAFLAAAPADFVGASKAVAPELLRPPLDRWPWVREPARRSYVRLLRSVVGAHPEQARRLAGPGPLGLAVRMLVASDRSSARLSASLLLAMRLPAVLLRRLRRGRTSRRPVRPREP